MVGAVGRFAAVPAASGSGGGGAANGGDDGSKTEAGEASGWVPRKGSPGKATPAERKRAKKKAKAAGEAASNA